MMIQVQFYILDRFVIALLVVEKENKLTRLLALFMTQRRLFRSVGKEKYQAAKVKEDHIKQTQSLCYDHLLMKLFLEGTISWQRPRKRNCRTGRGSVLHSALSKIARLSLF